MKDFLKSIFRFDLYEKKKYSFRLLLCILAMCILGVITLNSAMINDSERISTMLKQFMGIGLGFSFMMLLTFVDYHAILRLAPVVYGLNAALLLMVLTPLGVSRNGAQRWLKLGIQIQPSEFAKIFLIIFLAWFYMLNEKKINQVMTVFGGGLLFGITAFLVLMEPDLSTTLVLVFIFLCILYCAGISYKWILTAILIALPLLIICYVVLMQNSEWFFEHVYQARRILAWMYPDRYVTTGSNTQQLNSVMAISSGQLFGKGINNNSYESVKSGNFLSEENCDFIFAVIGEELGFAGCVVIIALVLILILLCLNIASEAPDLAGRLICVGMASLIGFQSFVNMGVASMLMPNTGLPFPFVSAGVSSLLSIFIGMGLVMNVALQRSLKEDDVW